jgi:hypothetical protein
LVMSSNVHKAVNEERGRPDNGAARSSTKLIIAGNRDLYVRDAFLRLHIAASGWDVGEIVTGDATGIDECARGYARTHSIPLEVFKAFWRKFGKAAGPIRNKQMVRYGDALLAIKNYKAESRGTNNIISQAREAGIPVRVVTVGADMNGVVQDARQESLL